MGLFSGATDGNARAAIVFFARAVYNRSMERLASLSIEFPRGSARLIAAAPLPASDASFPCAYLAHRLRGTELCPQGDRYGRLFCKVNEGGFYLKARCNRGNGER